MSYTAIRAMQKNNAEKYGINFPKQPDPIHVTARQGDMEQKALFFLRDRCEGLRFDPEVAEREKTTGRLEGTSAKKRQIPFNMEKDIDRRCMEHAVHRFMKTGTAADAFDVFYCYLEMFMGSYHTSKHMIELLSEFESNASALLMKHRDHYSHSAYVFVLGLSIYEANEYFRGVYKCFYNIENDNAAAHHFLEYWGLASLFHDIGYPFEIPFEQVKAYFVETGKQAAETGKEIKRQMSPNIAYVNMTDFNRLTEAEKEAVANQSLYAGAVTIYDLLAINIVRYLGDEYKLNLDTLKETLKNKPEKPDMFGNFMDHAFFSGTVLFRKLVEESDGHPLNPAHIDALTAIMLHNSLFKFSVANYKKNDKPLKPELHPLAYMLMLCDELQCWNRTSYGRNSRNEVHPIWCNFSFDKNEISALYVYDTEEQYKIELFERGEKPELKAYSGMKKGDFLADIRRVVALDKINLNVGVCITRASANRTTYLSDSNFLHLQNFAVALNGRYSGKDCEKELTDKDMEELEESFGALSLEYQLSNVAQAKKFAEYLHKLGCFYTDRPVNFEMLKEFTEDHMIVVGPLEHLRWEEEKKHMGWAYGNSYNELAKDKNESKFLREQFRLNNQIGVEYEDLDESEKNKDTEPMRLLLKLIRQFDGLRIYRLS